MTILVATVRDIAGIDDSTLFRFEVPATRGTDPAGTGIVTTRTYRVQPKDGELTTPDLEPGVCVVRIQGDPVTYRITIPDSVTSIQLWPLIEAAAPPGAGMDTTGFVHNAGGIERTQAVALADYPDLPKDPATLYVIFDS